MCTLGDEYTVSIVRNHNIQLSVPAGRAWTVIFCSMAPRQPVGLFGTTGISTDFALSQYSLSISIFINHNVCYHRRRGSGHDCDIAGGAKSTQPPPRKHRGD